MSWQVHTKGGPNRVPFEITVLRSDNKHGAASYGWFGRDKIMISCSGGPCGDHVSADLWGRLVKVAEDVASELNRVGPLGQDGKPHRLCDEDGCEFRGRHVVNCARCLGFGTARRQRSGGHLLEQYPPLAAADLEVRVSRDWLACPDCGGTPEGRKVTT